MAVWRLWILCGFALLAVKDGSGLIIGGCEEGSVDVVEESNPSFTCNSYMSRLQWTVYNDKMETIYSSFCILRQCKPLNDKVYFLENSIPFRINYKTLTMNGITRNSARTLSCNDSSTYARCDLRIIVKPVFRDCSVSISNWMVIGRCTMTNMYSSDNTYTCKWKENKNKEEFGGFQTSLTSYTRNSKNYTEGVCSFAKPMPLIIGNYTYTVSVSPGADDLFGKQIYIDAPYWVKLKHNCPEYVFEGSNVSCTCYASRFVSPPALLVWEGTSNSTLWLKDVSRRLNQEQFICRLEWHPDGSIKETTFFKLTVAYGPSGVLITSYAKKTDDESETILLTCTATDVYPSAVFQWNVTCYTQTDSRDSSTCPLNITHKSESLAILCTASNTYFHQAFVSDVYVLSSLGRQQTNTDGSNAGLIGGVTTAVLLVFIIAAVLVVYIIKRRKDPVYDEARRPDKNEHSYLGLALTGRKLLPTAVFGAGAGDETATSPDSENHHYEEMNITRQNAYQNSDSIYVVPMPTTIPGH